MIIAALAASAFICVAPTHHDGDAIRCKGQTDSMRLYGIDAPEMPGACRPERQCAPGDPFQSRAHLAELTHGKTITCTPMGTDRYNRIVVRCYADSTDLSCAMVRDGFAIERYGHLDCDDQSPAPSSDIPTQHLNPAVVFESVAQWQLLLLYFAFINLITYFAFWADKQRTRFRWYGFSEINLLTLAFLGGSPTAVFAQRHLRHKMKKEPFSTILLCILGIQFGVAIGLLFLF